MVRSPRNCLKADSPATTNAAVKPVASIMCTTRYGIDGLKMTSIQLSTKACPSRISKPAGVCIHELSASIQNAESGGADGNHPRRKGVHAVTDTLASE
ncbi:MAG: hypothetical protein U5K38_02700 [Woeseiaceae bacterium]|nr:hypothetical protein [Woeseiaceae bacterium]